MKTCEYCGCEALLVGGELIYPHRPDLYHLKFYYCQNGHSPAYVGCHKGTAKPLGRLADHDLRKAKQRAHYAFDPIWRSGSMDRNQAYSWLARQLNISRKDCHIGMFDIDKCQKVVEICEEFY